MAKMKTNRSAAKRFRKSGSGKLRRRRAFARHNLEKKTRKQKRRLKRPTDVSKADTNRVKRLLGKLA